MSDLFDQQLSLLVHLHYPYYCVVVSKRSIADEATKLRDVVINAKDITNPTR